MYVYNIFITFNLILGDPISCHATYIVFCRDMDRQTMILHSRVSSITNKKMVFAKESENSVKYLIYCLNDLFHDTPKKPIHFVF